MPKLVRLYIVNVLIGFSISALFLGLVLALDLAHLRHLVLETSGGRIAGLQFFLSNGIVFAGEQFAIAAISLAEGQGRGPRAGLRVLARLTPVTSDATAQGTGRSSRPTRKSLNIR